MTWAELGLVVFGALAAAGLFVLFVGVARDTERY